MYPVVHFLALAFADEAFHPKLVEAGLSVQRLHGLSCPPGRSMIDFCFREDILETPIFRPLVQRLLGREVDPSRALSLTPIVSWVVRLGERAGFLYRLKLYCLRRDVATSLNGLSISRPCCGLR